LERVLGIVCIRENPPTDAHDHRSVPFQKHGERQLGRLTLFQRKSFQELTVRQIPEYTYVEECIQPLE